ncbi:MAG: aspartyl protease family protein [Candidatus Eremiobacterota bacterium]
MARYACAQLDPSLPVLVSAPGTRRAVLVPALVDTGADLCVLPEGLARELRLPPVGTVKLQGFTGPDRVWMLYAAELRVEDRSELFQVLASATRPCSAATSWPGCASCWTAPPASARYSEPAGQHAGPLGGAPAGQPEFSRARG